MDRRSFINKVDNNEGGYNACGEAYCICDDAAGSKETRVSRTSTFGHLVRLSVLAFVCAASFFVVQKEIATNDEWTSVAPVRILSCAVNKSTGDNDQRQVSRSCPPVSRDNGNSCPHQWNAPGFLTGNDSKRKRNHVC